MTDGPRYTEEHIRELRERMERGEIAIPSAEDIFKPRYLSLFTNEREAQLKRERDHLTRSVFEALHAIHGPPPGGESTRKLFRFRETYERIRSEHRYAQPRAVRVTTEDGEELVPAENLRR